MTIAPRPARTPVALAVARTAATLQSDLRRCYERLASDHAPTQSVAQEAAQLVTAFLELERTLERAGAESGPDELRAVIHSETLLLGIIRDEADRAQQTGRASRWRPHFEPFATRILAIRDRLEVEAAEQGAGQVL